MTLCEVRRLQRAILEYERRFTEKYELSLNEGMLLCALRQNGRLCASQMAHMLDLTMSNTSKVIRSAEEKGLLQRSLCDEDKRQMSFSLTPEAERMLDVIESEPIELSEVLQCAIRSIDPD